MRVALVADPIWLMQEMTTFRRLAVGLVGEQVRVVPVVPDWWAQREDELPMTGDHVSYPAPQFGWRWLRDRRIRQTAGETLADKRVDLVHVLDGSLQRVGVEIGRALGVPVVCSVWSEPEVRLLNGGSGHLDAAYAPTTEPLAAAVREKLGGTAHVQTLAPGVYTGGGRPSAPPLEHAYEALNCVVIGDGQPDEQYEALLSAMTRVRQRLSHAMYFFYAVRSEQHELWRMTERYGLLRQIGLVPFEPGSRQLMVQADVLLQPQRQGRTRTIVLEAMAAGRPVLAAEDPLLDFLRDGQTARLVRPGDTDQWAALLGALVTDPEPFVRIGGTAREYVRRHHAASDYVSRTIQLYQGLAADRTLAAAG